MDFVRTEIESTSARVLYTVTTDGAYHDLSKDVLRLGLHGTQLNPPWNFVKTEHHPAQVEGKWRQPEVRSADPETLECLET